MPQSRLSTPIVGKRSRAPSSGNRLEPKDAALVKALLAQGRRQHDVAAIFKVNAGRISDVANRKKFADVVPASDLELMRFLASATQSH